MSNETTEITAIDVARELHATKLAIAFVLEDLVGTSPIEPTRAMETWIAESPVGLPEMNDSEFEAFNDRVDEIVERMKLGIAAFISSRVAPQDEATG